VIYLLDVNALLALGVSEHEFHQRTERWVEHAGAKGASFATCAITELGFLRILLQTSHAAFTVGQGQKHLQLLKSSSQFRFEFLADDQDAQQLPAWVKWPKQLTDGHLVALARAHGAALATLDEGIRGAFVIPR
jgi:predicted nucleic acid-binding protein